MVWPINLSIAVEGQYGKGEAWVIHKQRSIFPDHPNHSSCLRERAVLSVIPCTKLHRAALASQSFPDSSRNKRNHTLLHRGQGLAHCRLWLSILTERTCTHQASNCEVS